MTFERMRIAQAIIETCTCTPSRLDIDSLSTILSTSRRSIERALDELVSAQVIHRKTTAGRHGGTEVWRPPDAQLNAPFVAQLKDQKSPDLIPKNAAESAHLSDQIPAHLQVSDLDLLNLTKNSDPDPVPASSTRSRNHTTEGQSQLPMLDLPPESNPQPAAKPRPKPPGEIPAEAFRAADALRARILREAPEHKIGTAAWGEKSPTRVAWAREFERMNRLDRRSWGEIAGVIRWRYPDDPADLVRTRANMYTLDSAKYVREKFDRVQAARRRALTEPDRHNPRDNRPAPEFARIRDGWEDLK